MSGRETEMDPVITSYSIHYTKLYEFYLLHCLLYKERYLKIRGIVLCFLMCLANLSGGDEMNLFGSKSHGRQSILLTALLAVLCASPARNNFV